MNNVKFLSFFRNIKNKGETKAFLCKAYFLPKKRVGTNKGQLVFFEENKYP